jgi:predicted site-specific integrase-resolvase
MKRMLTKKQMAERYQVTNRTVERWTADKILPAPTIINKRWYFNEADIEQRERERMGAAQQPETNNAA